MAKISNVLTFFLLDLKYNLYILKSNLFENTHYGFCYNSVLFLKLSPDIIWAPCFCCFAYVSLGHVNCS